VFGKSSTDWADFLHRAPFTPAPECDLALAQKTVLLSGAGGSIGSGLAIKLMESSANKLLLLDCSERRLRALYDNFRNRTCKAPAVEFLHTDILDGTALRQIFSRYHPDIVFHAAALKQLVPLEHDPFGALENNVVGTLQLLQNADATQVTLFVNVSTDKAVNPTSVLGVSKRITELVLLAKHSSRTRRITVRLGNVLGSSDSVVPIFLDSIVNHRPLQVTHPQATRYFVTLDDVVILLMNCMRYPFSSILLPNMGIQQRILDLAEFLMKQFPTDTDGKALNFVGLRDGEKCSERLTYEFEHLEETNIPDLYRVCGNCLDNDVFYDRLARLLQIIETRHIPRLIEVLSEIVPEFSPSPTLLRCVS
jgi:FlaA1/EpsC-like NDP-sugar epimerase